MKHKTNSFLNILWLIALVLFTPITGLILNSDVFSARSILLLLMWSVVLLVPYVGHYYFLENSVQELYLIYDVILSRADARGAEESEKDAKKE